MFIIDFSADIVNLGVLNTKSNYDHVMMINQSKVWTKKIKNEKSNIVPFCTSNIWRWRIRKGNQMSNLNDLTRRIFFKQNTKIVTAKEDCFYY